MAGTQTFFPAQIDVALVPARADEVNELLAQTEGEPAIDLASGVPAQILVLVPLPPANYATLAAALLGPVSNQAPPAFKPYPSVALSRIDPLVLRLPPRPIMTTPAAAWTQIWALAPADLPWMVRPTDGGLGGVKAAMLAAGFTVPVPPPTLPPLPPITFPPTTTTIGPVTTTTPPATTATGRRYPRPAADNPAAHDNLADHDNPAAHADTSYPADVHVPTDHWAPAPDHPSNLTWTSTQLCCSTVGLTGHLLRGGRNGCTDPPRCSRAGGPGREPGVLRRRPQPDRRGFRPSKIAIQRRA